MMNRFRTRTLPALALATFIPVGGCSFVTLGPPRAPASPGEPVQCSESSVAPALDTLAAIGSGLASLYFLALSAGICSIGEHSSTSCMMNPTVLGGFLATGAYVAAAGYGHRQTSACRAVKRGGAACDPVTGMDCGPLGLPHGTAPVDRGPVQGAEAGR